MDVVGRDAGLFQHGLRVVHHRFRPADKGVVIVAEIQQRAADRRQAFTVDAAAEQRAVETFLAEQIQLLKTLRVAVFRSDSASLNIIERLLRLP